MTDIKVKIFHGAKLKALRKAFNDAKVVEQWGKTAWAKKLAIREKRANASDFDRFVILKAKKKVQLHFSLPSIITSLASSVQILTHSFINIIAKCYR